MEEFARIGMGLMLLVSVAVGARLLWLSKRTRMLPEFVMAIASLGTGIGSALIVQGTGRAQQAWGSELAYAGIALTSTGCVFLCAGMWRIFRLHELWAVMATTAAGLTLVASFAVLLGVDHAGRLPTEHPAYWVGFAVRIATFGWVASESLRYAGLLRRRAALGLAESGMAGRFLCWGVSALTTCLAYGVYLWSMLARQTPPPLAQAVIGLLGIATGAAMWTAFFPPRLRGWRPREGDARG